MSKGVEKSDKDQALAVPYDKNRALQVEVEKTKKDNRLADARRERANSVRSQYLEWHSQVCNGAVMMCKAWMNLYKAFLSTAEDIGQIKFPLLKKMNLPPRFMSGNKEEELARKTTGGAPLFGDQTMLESAAYMIKLNQASETKEMPV